MPCTVAGPPPPCRTSAVRPVPASARVTSTDRPGPSSMVRVRVCRAIVDACRDLVRTGAEVTMPEVARRALVSEATAYRYFPDLTSLLAETIDGLWPSPAEALAPVASSADPVERVRFACEFLLRGVLSYQGAVRAMISGTITRPGLAPVRPGIRFGLIDYALAPFGDGTDLAQLKRDLAVTVSAEALFTLTDLCGLGPDEAIASAAQTAATLTAAAFSGVRETRPVRD